MQEAIQEALINSFIWLGKKILQGTFLVSDFIFPIFCVACIGLSLTGLQKPRKYALSSWIIYLFMQVFRIFI